MALETIAHIKGKRILFSPLNWGFGHVSRSIPIIEKLLLQKNSITIACNENQEKIYKEYFKEIKFVRLEGYPFQFSGSGNFALDLLKSMPKLISFGKREKEFVNEYCSEETVDLILSDHRYFFRSSKVESIFITHQITLPLTWYLKLAQKMHMKWLNAFHEIWVIDDEKHSFAGKLSEGLTQIPQRFLGAVSRFSSSKATLKSGTIVLISGPEPYAEEFYNEQYSKLKTGDRIVYEGKLETIDSIQDISWKELDTLLIGAEKIISRSGYTTLMDVHFLKCKAEFHPTKGQWEQEYLSNYLDKSLTDN
jgi:hypothetical protein